MLKLIGHGSESPGKVVAMRVLALCESKERAGSHPGWACCATTDPAHYSALRWCVLLALLASAAVHAEDRTDGLLAILEPSVSRGALPPDAAPPPAAVPVADKSQSRSDALSLAPPRMVGDDDGPDLQQPAYASLSRRAGSADDAPGSGAIDRQVETFRSAPRPARLHLDDVSSATGFAEGGVRRMALAMDTPLSRNADGLTLQSRVEMAYRPGMAPVPGNWDAPPGESSATGLSVRLYGSRPTRISGVYPFVEADWWQDNRAKSININGTRIDTDLLRGLLSFNVGAHRNSVTGLKVWMKARGGHNAGATLGARYRW